MLRLNTNRLRRITLRASLIAVVGLGSSILAGNEDGLIVWVPVAQQKALLVLALAVAVRAVCVWTWAGKKKPGESTRDRPAQEAR